jgi:hypothetical protein
MSQTSDQHESDAASVEDIRFTPKSAQHATDLRESPSVTVNSPAPLAL